MAWRWLAIWCAGLMTVACGSTGLAWAEDYPAFDKVIEGYKKIEPANDETQSLYTLYIKENEGELLIELPKNYATKNYFIGLTVASGQLYAGLQAGDFYVQWREYNKRLALIAPNTQVRSGGDKESKDSVDRLFTGRVLLDLPILTVSPRGGPVIDGDQMLVANASVFFGSDGRSSNARLAKIIKSKVFPQNIELAFELPNIRGNLQTLYYSISEIPQNTGYTPRVADQRIGYFTTSYSDFGKYKKDEVDIHFINRWHLQKRDPSLQISPPVEPIKFYIEHTTPVRYRRWVKQGVMFWNEAFEKIGISDAIEVVYQDKSTKENMEKDPEDVRYNFVRWLNNNEGTAIGPSRVHPETGQILDADIILTDGWIRHYNENFADYMPLLAMEGMGPETLAWLGEHPNWDPRVRFSEPSRRQQVLTQLRTQQAERASGLDAIDWSTKLMGDHPLDGLVGRTSQVNGLCLAATGRKLDTSIMRMLIALGPDALLADTDEKEKEKKEGDEQGDAQAKTGKTEDASAEDKKGDEKPSEKKPDAKEPEESMLDGMPESFIGPLIADLVAHEVGHTLGLRHNFKASSIYSLKQINSAEVKDRKAMAGSVMDYLPINLRIKEGDEQGNFTMINLGPYDFWAIEYGYTFEKDLSKILSRVSEPELQFATDEDTTGPDPLARRYDFSAEPLKYAQEQARLIERFRKKLMTDYVKDGDSWTKARDGFELTLNLQMKNTSMMANWVGSSYINRDKKGDLKERLPIEVVAADRQREALKFVLESTFRDEAYALSPELLARLTKDFMSGFGGGDPAWPVHDRILAMQASALTMLMNATTLRRVYDNESRIPSDQDAFALPELLGSISSEIWSELDSDLSKQFSSRNPMISSLRRNLQREHLDRLIDLTMPSNGASAAYKAISNLCVMELHGLKKRIDQDLEAGDQSLDPYTKAHLFEASQRIGKALDADYIYNQPAPNSFGIPFLFFGEGTEAKPSGSNP